MAISNIKSTTVHVSDQDAAVDFYTNKLGFEKRADEAFGEGYRWIEVAPPGADTVIILAKDYGAWDQSRIGKFAGVVFATDNVQQTYEELKSRGVEFTEVPTTQPWGMVQAQFNDQDGNGFVLVGK